MRTYWQTITLAKVEDRESKDESKYYMRDVNPAREAPSEPIYFKNRWHLILLAGMILGFCVWPSQTWVELKAFVKGEPDPTSSCGHNHTH